MYKAYEREREILQQIRESVQTIFQCPEILLLLVSLSSRVCCGHFTRIPKGFKREGGGGLYKENVGLSEVRPAYWKYLPSFKRTALHRRRRRHVTVLQACPQNDLLFQFFFTSLTP